MDAPHSSVLIDSQSRPVSSSTSRSFMTGSFIDSDVIREHRAFIGNVAPDTSKPKLKRILEDQIGAVRSLNMVVDKHCAFAEFATREIFNMAVSIGFVVVDGRRLKIEQTKEQTKSQSVRDGGRNRKRR
ncbi:7307_t:CDS:2 [Paraglomus brasilianum]|uniref:7307_t:CDS:1 n=1 Tax=Paraglomus brasilianum TaxID=144538 RepID=A0A9N9FBE5_9GLOM|nr:7307_t:CDS:2 [Paraglomus brasilianum]